MKADLHPTPAPVRPKSKISGGDFAGRTPEHLSTDTPSASREEKIDKQMADSFPASDPPSFSGGNHIIGAPKERESDAATADSPEVKDAEKRVKDGTAKETHKY